MAGAAHAQRSHAYWVATPGAVTAGSTAFRLGTSGGGELAIAKGFAAGAEIGMVGPVQHFADRVLGVVSASGYYHPVWSKTARLDPFGAAGWSLLFRDGTRNMLNYGGGLNYWFARDMALRTEFRDHTFSNGGARVHYWGVRIGVSFRRFSP